MDVQMVRMCWEHKYEPFFCLIFIWRDAAALAQFWSWLETEIHKGATLTEVEVADKLLEFRSKQDGFVDTSFDTISGTTPIALLTAEISILLNSSTYFFDHIIKHQYEEHKMADVDGTLKYMRDSNGK